MRKYFLCGLTCLACFGLSGKSQIISGNSFIKEMKWGIDYQINLTLANDSSYSVNINDLQHSNRNATDSVSKEFIYYPVMLASDFVDKLKKSKDIAPDTLPMSDAEPVSLWSALHNSIGGGWIHFVNCLQYSLEKQYLSLTAPLMTRPKSDWKPKPITETWKRTHKWVYYVPMDQKLAHKEYQKKKKEKNLANLQDVPSDFIRLFESTSNKEYTDLVNRHDYHTLSKIDLVKLLLGSNYLGNAQLSYIKSMVLKSVVHYSFNQLPTIIVFDDLEAAVAMSLNENGYRIDKAVFKNAAGLSGEEQAQKQVQMEQTIRLINKVNQKVMEERLKKYYR
jgi:hypothetical protein